MNEIETLPQLFPQNNDKQPISREEWDAIHRPHIIKLFTDHVYGCLPSPPVSIKYNEWEKNTCVFNGRARRSQTIITCHTETGDVELNTLLYLPITQDTPVPVFIILNFHGNSTIDSDDAIALPCGFVRDTFSPIENYRGVRHSRYPIETICNRGYGLLTLYCGDSAPDDPIEYQKSILIKSAEERKQDTTAGGTISAWAWSLSRAMDYCECHTDIDTNRVAVVGHSRLGKTALWATAHDSRFALCIANNSGCAGAAITRGKKGERIADITRHYPYWFCTRYSDYAGKEEQLPIDQHMLIALCAPRPVYIASAI